MLEQRKHEAIQGEDFETAKALKMRMEQLKDLIRNHDPEHPFSEQLQEQYMPGSAAIGIGHNNVYSDDRPLPSLQNQQ